MIFPLTYECYILVSFTCHNIPACFLCYLLQCPALLLQINTDCPDFDSVFESTENKATLVCNSLTVRLDQIGMCYFKKFVEELQNRYCKML